jgi:hypothetical protein
LASFASVGISTLQGPHQVAQVFITTTLPLKSAIFSGFPSGPLEQVVRRRRRLARPGDLLRQRRLGGSTGPV